MKPGHFSFILTEQALRWRQAEDDVMVRQAARLVEISQRPNIDLAVLPLDAVVRVPALNLFVVFDDRLVIVETFSGETALRDPRDVAYHVNLFDYFYGLCLTGDYARTRITQQLG